MVSIINLNNGNEKPTSHIDIVDILLIFERYHMRERERMPKLLFELVPKLCMYHVFGILVGTIEGYGK